MYSLLTGLLRPSACTGARPFAPAAASQSFLETEGRLYRDLTTLIIDAKWLRGYGR